MDYIYDNHLDYNVFMPNIILYCLKEKYDKDKFIKVIENAYNSYDYLLGFYELNDDEYHLFVQVWLINKEGLFLSQERSENISWPLMWCANGGNAKMGEDAYTCARREVLEELKIDINDLDGFMFDSSTYFEDNQNYFCDSFVYVIDKDIKDIDYQKKEALLDLYK